MAKKEQIQDNLPRLKQAIRDQNPERLYIFHGEEVYLLHHYLSQLEKMGIDRVIELKQEALDAFNAK